MQFNPISKKDLSFFTKTLGPNFVYTDDEALSNYGKDHTEDFIFPPEVVLKPGNSTEVSAVLAYCNEHLIPVSPRGAGTSLSGGSLPIHGGVSLSMERFNKILEIDEDNFQATVEPGVINDVFREAVEEKGLFYPPDPASKGSCFLGGNIAHNSGGPKALKYGITRDYVLNLEVVLASGEILWTGANVLKNSTGYNLTHLIVGSEGTLGVVTKIVFKLLAKPKYNVLMLAYFSSIQQACSTVSSIFKAGANPSALELMERNGVQLVTDNSYQKFPFQEKETTYLLIEVDGNDKEQMYATCEVINQVLENHNVIDVLFAESEEEKNRLWKVRRSIGEYVKLQSIYKEEDTVVPRANLPELMTYIKKLEKEYGFECVCYGHAGDGNLHINILKNDLSDAHWNHTLPTAIRKLFNKCKELNGTISGEHGIGMVQKEYLDIVFKPIHFKLMRQIKKSFDPRGILNPGKIFDGVS